MTHSLETEGCYGKVPIQRVWGESNCRTNISKSLLYVNENEHRMPKLDDETSGMSEGGLKRISKTNYHIGGMLDEPKSCFSLLTFYSLKINNHIFVSNSQNLTSHFFRCGLKFKTTRELVNVVVSSILLWHWMDTYFAYTLLLFILWYFACGDDGYKNVVSGGHSTVRHSYMKNVKQWSLARNHFKMQYDASGDGKLEGYALTCLNHTNMSSQLTGNLTKRNLRVFSLKFQINF